MLVLTVWQRQFTVTVNCGSLESILLTGHLSAGKIGSFPFLWLPRAVGVGSNTPVLVSM